MYIFMKLNNNDRLKQPNVAALRSVIAYTPMYNI